ncbi:MAG TPA: hypothetical protein VD913_06520, partial [bacterium]|nr:hypothetical protein [bacterium]
GTVDGALFKRLSEAKGIPYELVKNELFDLSASRHGRVRWKKGIHSVPVLLTILGRQEQEVWDLVDLYTGSYDEKEKFRQFLGFESEPEWSVDFVRKALEKVHEAVSIFSIQLLQDWFSLQVDFEFDAWNFRINFPGTTGGHNWTLAMPWSLEKMMELSITGDIKKINSQAGRI